MNTIENIKERFHKAQLGNGSSQLKRIEQNAFDAFDRWGVPTVRHEEWKYTRISGLFNKPFAFVHVEDAPSISTDDLDSVRLAGHEIANELVFVNGIYSASLSN